MQSERINPVLIEQAAILAEQRLEGVRGKKAGKFARLYYAGAEPPPGANDSETLLGRALSQFLFAEQRLANQAKVRAFNPNLEEHGWRSAYSVVELVVEDMPFIVDSVVGEIRKQGFTVHALIHPVILTDRDQDGQIAGFNEEGKKESFVHIGINRLSEGNGLENLAASLFNIIADVRLAVGDWLKMRGALAHEKANLDQETGEFLHWLDDEHFTFLGMREYALEAEELKPKSGLGILTDPERIVLEQLRGKTPELSSFISGEAPLIITKANRRSTIHRSVHMDLILLKKKEGNELKGILMFAGLFTATVYTGEAIKIPLLRRKVEAIAQRAGFDANSHDGRNLAYVIETIPRDEMFQMSEEELFETAMGILRLRNRPRIGLFVRRDPFERFVAAIAFVPRDRYGTTLRTAWQGVLERAFNGRLSAHHVEVSDNSLARLHFIIKTTPGQVPAYNTEEIEVMLKEAARTWEDRLYQALIEAKGEEAGINLFRRYAQAFPLAYRERFSSDLTVLDIDKIEGLEKSLAMKLYRPLGGGPTELRLKLYHAKETLALSDILPTIENMGLKVISEHTYHLNLPEQAVIIHDFSLESRFAVDLHHVRKNFQEAFAKVWNDEAEDDGFNKLVLLLGFNWREAALFRAYAKYLRQAGIGLSQDYLEKALAENPQITKKLLEFFQQKFMPPGALNEAEKTKEKLEEMIGNVASLDHDRILRRFLSVIQATLRTNYYQERDFLSFKLDSHKMEGLPQPRPMVEIWVCSPKFEAIHLRGGRVARGGIRWSDRKEDFRNEILGLMKAQMVKNAVIVPVGAKGGFIVKNPPTSRPELLEEGINCYKTMIRAMLELTDNLKDGRVIAPSGMVRYDGDDPYLVVAADKGTASFSDIANKLSLEHGFWLGDAFASGGSQGYDHKGMGITARGAWIAVERHLQEAGFAPDQDFTVVGVGDMAGDVFGNGMLLSSHIKLVGAFNHQHIFIDPNPDPKLSWEERRRLFQTPGSQWSDYDLKLISQGGGVFRRDIKAIAVTPEMRQAFALGPEDKVAPTLLIQAMLKAEVDLLWLGGIGTFVKASTETNLDAADRANDALRVDAADLCCKAVGEGANLGFTQKARIEYALKGGRINTDAIDNSAGVDTSDHEVNLKILLDKIVKDGDLTLKQRNHLLKAMTDEVAALVLADNQGQTAALSLAEHDGVDYSDFIHLLEKEAKLDRKLEFLPPEGKLLRRLTRPELAIVMAYGKNWLYNKVMNEKTWSNEAALRSYFPASLQNQYWEAIKEHPLQREITATVLANQLVNNLGLGLLAGFRGETGELLEKWKERNVLA